MLPMAKGDKYELVPLASLTPNEIVEYVQREKKIKKAELELAMESKMRQKEALRS